MDNKINDLLKTMTLKEKIGQLYQAPYFSDVITGHAFDSSATIQRIKDGRVGSILSVHDEKVLYQLQKTAVEESRLGIPLLFAFDVIHGYKTSFPINLALSNTWDMDLIERISKAVAFESTKKGLHLTFSPMVDLVRDPRWGRVMESNGEDPYLSSCLAKAYIKGYQGNDLSHPDTIAACAKHFIGYGLSEAGREYNTVDLSKRVLYNMYLPAFKAAVEANVQMVMTSFNTVFDVPSTANKALLKDILREELDFKNVIISDYTSTEEIINHGIARDLKDVAEQCFNAGLEMEMVSESYISHLEELVHEGKVKESDIDDSVSRILTLKYKLGLFDNPFKYFYENSDQYMLLEKTRELSREAAEKSMVLLKNNQVLPLKKETKIMLCGPMIKSQDLIGEWAALTSKDDVVSIFDAFSKDKTLSIIEESGDEAIKNAEVIIMALGEPGNQAGEGNSKTHLHLADEQKAYFDKVYQLNQNIVLIVFAGRPLIMTDFANKVKALIYAYQPGLEAGNALKRLMYGDCSFSGKITMTFPYHQGQIPIYYNHYATGRPFDPQRPNYRYNTRYIDCPNEPLYPFGYGLSYGKFVYKNFIINQHKLNKHDKLFLQVEIENQSQYPADEIIQCYIQAKNFSVSRPVNELKSFKRVSFKAYETKTIDFTLDINDFRSYNINMEWTAEYRDYFVKVGPNSQDLLSISVNVVD
ncbi:beta-glucosidase [Hujiaoplasma nucleasis]|uniref:beta-glucosidase n=1 Tax=Hujiaoplasma nucleasis TaxID=2725268 RepID=A0A7L6N4W5_9MOLU|nr:glycoside hydrolase family 3 N-terminal domain-containing protein [Hujiaoplasma nucleasis]QLY39544.1 beta-glucosidase [Hujiaoplasma nucleasis]